MSDVQVIISPQPTATVALAIGAPGPQGPAGTNGSDASVTSSNISSALGYTPVSQSKAVAFSIAL